VTQRQARPSFAHRCCYSTYCACAVRGAGAIHSAYQRPRTVDCNVRRVSPGYHCRLSLEAQPSILSSVRLGRSSSSRCQGLSHRLTLGRPAGLVRKRRPRRNAGSLQAVRDRRRNGQWSASIHGSAQRNGNSAGVFRHFRAAPAVATPPYLVGPFPAAPLRAPPLPAQVTPSAYAPSSGMSAFDWIGLLAAWQASSGRQYPSQPTAAIEQMYRSPSEVTLW
jgi:hypothetical protein